MQELKKEYQRVSFIQKAIPVTVLAVTGILGATIYHDLSSPNKVAAQQVVIVQQGQIDNDIIPTLGESARLTASKTDLELLNENSLDSTLESLENYKKRIAEAKAKAEAEAKAKAEAEAKAKAEAEAKAKAQLPNMLNTKVITVPLGTKTYPSKVLKQGDLIKKYSTMFGVDPYVIASLLSQESSGNLTLNNATSAGIAQIDSALKDEFISFGKNYFNQTWDLNDRYSAAPSIAFCAYRISTYLKHYNGDYCKALQANNFSHYSLDLLIDKFGSNWMNHTKEMAYYNGHYRRTGSTRYGDPNYVRNVLGFYNPTGL